MILQASKLCHFYRQGEKELPVLKNLDFTLIRGETVAILGKSGSGKSTLLSLLAGLDRPQSGEIQVEGTSIVSLDEAALTTFRARRIGIVFQQFHLLPQLTAIENVSLPLEIAEDESAMSKAAEVLERIGLTERARHYPHQLSGGEKQRIAIARAIVIRPPLLFADEPSGNLDDVTGERVMKLLFDLVHEIKTALVLVTHNAELASRCDRKLLLSEGRLT